MRVDSVARLRIEVAGQVRDAPILKAYLAARGDWRDWVERKLRQRTAGIQVGRTDFERVRIHLCIVEGAKLRIEQTSNWGGSKRLRLFEADAVIGIDLDERGMPTAPGDAVYDRIINAALAVTAQVYLLLKAELQQASSLLQGTDLRLEDLVRSRRKP